MIKSIKKIMPKISDTERAALECGTISIDGDIFRGVAPTVTPTDYRVLTKAERTFLDVTVPAAIKLQRELGYTKDRDLHKKMWKFLKDNKFFAMIIPESYGGLGFTPTAQSLVVSKIASAGYPALAVTVMVPNSLGPGELLLHYGTDAQKDKYLTKLASGKLIPCFGLTGLHNGSDATSIIDTAGTTDDGKYVVTLNKRYITLAPVADLIGLAINVPGKGITLFLVERDHPGLEIGDRHDPMGQPFMNGTIRGTIVLDESHVLGGTDYVGKGWQMLVECLSVGRAISLPALGTAASARCAIAAGAYSQARKQFGMSICKFEGIQEELAEITYQSYLTHAVQQTINGELQKGESPSALSAMWKYQATERGRKAVTATMDVLAGSAIQEGPNNVIADTYKSMPIAITVEGANILSRSLVTFGGGLMRSHPHLKDMVDAIQAEDTAGFLKHLSKLAGHAGLNFGRSVLGSKWSLFAFTADMVLTLGKKYKTSEYISSRMADIFSIRVFEAAVRAQEAGPLREYVLKRLHNEEAQAYRDVIAEMPMWSGALIRLARFGKLKHKHISVADNKLASAYIASETPFIKKLCDYVHLDGRMQELVDSYTSKNAAGEVIEVDSQSGK